jgi:hypothetical protein
MLNLHDFKKNIYSQFGEDGILSELVQRLPQEHLNFTAIEFGAWDGIHLSNIANLVKNHNFRGCFIEADKKRFEDLEKNYPKNHILVNKFVTTSGNGSLDFIFTEHNLERDPDILSIDIDGNDLNVWKSLKLFRPKIVIIEYNPTIPANVNYTQDDNFELKFGNSALSISLFAESMKYSLVGITDTNLIFLDCKYLESLMVKIQIYSDDSMPNRNPVYLFSGYDGSLQLSGTFYMPWHGLVIERKSLQVLPKIICKFPDDYSRWEKIIFRVFLIYRSGVRFAIRKIINRIQKSFSV